jgi:hypothetical protein
VSRQTVKRPADRRSPSASIPREITRPCNECNGAGHGTVPNPEFFRRMRIRAGLTLKEMGRVLGVSYSAVSLMEHGRQAIRPEHVAIYDRLFERRRRAGETA